MSKLALYRESLGLTQKQLAERVGCHEAQISHWETGLRTPNLANLIKLLDALGCGVDDIF